MNLCFVAMRAYIISEVYTRTKYLMSETVLAAKFEIQRKGSGLPGRTSQMKFCIQILPVCTVKKSSMLPDKLKTRAQPGKLRLAGHPLEGNTKRSGTWPTRCGSRIGWLWRKRRSACTAVGSPTRPGTLAGVAHLTQDRSPPSWDNLAA